VTPVLRLGKGRVVLSSEHRPASLRATAGRLP